VLLDLAERVRGRRKVLGFSQEALAHRADLSLNLVNKIERGVILDPHISTLVALADALEVSVVDLVGEPQREQDAPEALAGAGPLDDAPRGAGQSEESAEVRRREVMAETFRRLLDLLERRLDERKTPTQGRRILGFSQMAHEAHAGTYGEYEAEQYEAERSAWLAIESRLDEINRKAIELSSPEDAAPDAEVKELGA
jgi:transcriptional regulator with XRE-family HTH domain